MLQDYRFNLLKIDMVFMRNASPESRQLVAAIVKTAKSLGILTLIEGVETEEQAQFIRSIGGDTIQGFYYSEPLEAEKLCAYLSGRRVESPDEKPYWNAICHFDLLTANPPYVMDRERAAMRPNVLEHEPALALFVPDEDPLVFYRAVARWARTLLRPGGWGYAEINALLGPETAAVFRDAGFSGVSLLQDLGGASRFVRFFI
jgi:hypothetical protein